MPILACTQLLFAAAVALAMAATFAPARAGEGDGRDILLLSGFQTNAPDAYAYVGTIIPLTDEDLGDDGVLLKLWADWVAFDYQAVNDGFNDQDVDGTRYGLQVAIGYQEYFGDSRITAYAGPEFRHVDIDPDDPESNIKGADISLKLQLEGYHAITDRWDVSAIVGYSIWFQAIYAKMRPSWRIWEDDSIRIGPEFVFLDGPKYEKQRGGVAVSGIRLGGASLGGSVGMERESKGDTTMYFGVNFAYIF